MNPRVPFRPPARALELPSPIHDHDRSVRPPLSLLPATFRGYTNQLQLRSTLFKKYRKTEFRERNQQEPTAAAHHIPIWLSASSSCFGCLLGWLVSLPLESLRRSWVACFVLTCRGVLGEGN
jgi:hypothetical protein